MKYAVVLKLSLLSIFSGTFCKVCSHVLGANVYPVHWQLVLAIHSRVRNLFRTLADSK